MPERVGVKLLRFEPLLVDTGTTVSQVESAAACEGKGCERCDDRGYFWITDCPYKQFIDPDMMQLARFTKLLKRGLPPVAGGALDQENWFLDASEYLRCEQSRHSIEALED